MIPDAWRAGEVAVIGMGKSGAAAAELLARGGARVYLSDLLRYAALESEAVRLRGAGVDVELGRHDLGRIARASLAVVSPGVPPDAPPVTTARAAAVPIVSEVEVGLRHLAGVPCIAITGTNGKTTSTALVAHMLRTLGYSDAVDAGNIGTPVSVLALAAAPPSWMALEMSSFQLHDTPSLAPTVGVLTNLSPDHLDRYATVDAYYADKALLFQNAGPGSRWVLNADDARSLALPERAGRTPLPGITKHFSLREHADAWYDRAAGTLVVFGAPLIARADVALIGDHNVANVLAASLAVILADDAHRTADARRRLARAVLTFRALPHRLEGVGEYGGVLWINDSKATNVSSTLVAVAGMTRPAIVLLGGRHKGEPYTALADPLREHARLVIAYGEAGPTIARDLDGVVPVETLGSDFGDVIARARAAAAPGDVVLLSPACSSYDMFRNYEERGAAFRRLAAAPT